MMDWKYLADKLFPHIVETPEQVEARYPKRNLPEGAKVTRMGPSPTGFMHLGNLYGALVDERLAHQSGGVFYLRIEDTDRKREVEGGVQTIIDAFSSFDLPFDEGATLDGETGAYGPYRQSQRAEIYQTFVKHLMARGMAYPCFCTEEELAAAHAEQEKNKENFGYYGKYAIWRDRTLEDIEAELAKGTPYVVRFRSEGSIENKIRHEDLVKGKMEVTENDQDVVIIKSDGIPTYHFAHVVDDHLMGTTIVVRDGETGAYGPYRQSQRAEIYQTFVKHLMARGMAYPCFCTEEELAAAHAEQEKNKENFGYYGKYAIWRDRTLEDIEAELAKGTPYVVRFRSEGSIENKIRHEDLVKGKMEVTENDQDVVIIKSDGIPTYHFAHVVDDHLMGTTIVVRGEEWLATLPVHLQLFRAMGWKAPKYAHTAQLMKIDEETGGKRKLSKRKDPELALTYYAKEGYPAPCVLEYLIT